MKYSPSASFVKKNMKKMQSKTSLWIVMLIILLIPGCEKNNPAPLSLGSTSKCVLQSETNGLIGNEGSWAYEYDAEGNPALITRFNRYGIIESTLEIFYDGIVRTRGTTIVKTSYDANIHQSLLPSKAQVSITMDGVEQRNYWTYFFFYDAQNRLVKIGEQTDHIANDWEYDLIISYDEHNNVTQLFYERTTGPREAIPPVTVTAYDDKPSPYTGVKSYKFLMNNYNWDNYDPGYILAALSVNNPLDYTIEAGDTMWKRTMTYQYNEHGFPIECINTNTSKNGESTFVQTFSYRCQ